MDHENVVKLYEYTETKDEYVMYMEYCDRAGYLADKILEVSYEDILTKSIATHPY